MEIKESIHSFEYEVNGERGKIAYRRWSMHAAATPRRTVICAHGINQTSRHFQELAQRLAHDFDVVALDFPGRGLSDYLSDKLRYNYSTYVPLCRAWIASLGVPEVYWVGTSMGGLIGILVAALPDTPIAKLVLNDIGPVIPLSTLQEALQAAKYAARRFASVEDVVERTGKGLAQFGIVEREMALKFMHAGMRQEADGSWRYDLDPGIYAYTTATPDINEREMPFWDRWESVDCPLLVLHGELSTTLTPEIIARMRERRPDMQVIAIPGVGHAPHLMDDRQAQWIRAWLQADVQRRAA